MITTDEVLKDLEHALNKVNIVKKTFSNNYIWLEVQNRLSELVDFIKKDKRIYNW